MSAAQASLRAAEARRRLEAWRLNAFEEVAEQLLAVPTGTEDLDFMAELLATGDYQYVEPDWRVFPGYVPDDPLLGEEWHLAHIGAPAAWDVSLGDPSILVGVVDSGVDLQHPDLKAALLPGYDATAWATQLQGGKVNEFAPHGSSVAGCLAASGNNGLGVAGMAWGVRILPALVSKNLFNGGAYLSDINRAARWTAMHGARVVNISYGGGLFQSSATTGSFNRSLGALTVWGAGNEAVNLGQWDPDSLVIVGASTYLDTKASFSSFGKPIDLVAPGVRLLTTAKNGAYIQFSGTSAATPVVSGVAALVLSTNPRLTPAQVESILFDSAVELANPFLFGRGRVDAAAAVRLAAQTAAESSAPFANDNVVATMPGAAIAVEFMRDDGDPNGDPIRLVDFDERSEQGGTVALLDALDPKDQRLVYHPPACFAGGDSFGYRISDSEGLLASGRISVQVGGSVLFGDPRSIALEHPPGSIAARDFSGDGAPDLLLGCFAPSFSDVELLLNEGHGRFAPPVRVPAASVEALVRHMVAGDMDHDGDQDFALLSESPSSPSQREVRVLLNEGSGGFELAPVLALQAGPSALLLTDIEGDGDLDLVAFSPLQLLVNDGTGGFAAPLLVSDRLFAAALAADLDGDGLLDLLAASESSTALYSDLLIFLQEPGGTFGPPSSVPLPPGAIELRLEGLAAADLDLDGDTDVVARGSGLASGRRVLLYANDGTGQLEFVKDHSPGPIPLSLNIADIDGDGLPDIVTCSEVNAANEPSTWSSVAVLRNRGALRYEPDQYWMLPATSPSLEAELLDLDQDGRIDVLVTSTWANCLVALLNRTVARDPNCPQRP